MSQISVNVQAIARRFGLPFIVLASTLLFVEFSHSEQNRLPKGLQDTLAEQALSFLRKEYNVLVSGDAPTEGLVPRLNGMTRLEVSGEERIAALQKGRENSLQHGMHYSDIEVALSPVGIEERDGEVVLHAIDEVVEYFTFDRSPSPPIPTEYRETTRHHFVFSVSPTSAH